MRSQCCSADGSIESEKGEERERGAEEGGRTSEGLGKGVLSRKEDLKGHTEEGEHYRAEGKKAQVVRMK